MPFYLRLENGDRILLENLAGYLILEDSTPGPTVNYQMGGAGHPGQHRKKRRNETQALFDRIERTLQEAMGLVSPVSASAAATEGASLEAVQAWEPAQLEAAVADLAALAAGSHDRETRLELLRLRLAQLIDDDERSNDDDEFWMLMG